MTVSTTLGCYNRHQNDKAATRSAGEYNGIVVRSTGQEP